MHCYWFFIHWWWKNLEFQTYFYLLIANQDSMCYEKLHMIHIHRSLRSTKQYRSPIQNSHCCSVSTVYHMKHFFFSFSQSDKTIESNREYWLPRTLGRAADQTPQSSNWTVSTSPLNRTSPQAEHKINECVLLWKFTWFILFKNFFYFKWSVYNQC